MSKKLFDFCIGNPPYNTEFSSDGNATYASPVYNEFMDATYTVADKVELIHPARFLFNAGSTPKAWNRKMLSDPQFKVLLYEEDCKKLFNNTEIKGGIAITYHDIDANFGAIGTFTPFEKLNSVKVKVENDTSFSPMSSIVISAYSYRFTKAMHEDFPDAAGRLSKGHAFDLKSNVFEKLPDVFVEHIDKCDEIYAKMLGLVKGKRAYRYIRKRYLDAPENIDKYKVLMPAANGSGAIGETLSSPLIGEPLVGGTETFISIGCFDTFDEANALLKYIKTKFSRAMLGILKVTQHVTPDKWRYVPLQDFTSSSDIDWSKSIHEIDLQLYRKYGLSKEEIDFIETHVKEMV